MRPQETGIPDDRRIEIWMLNRLDQPEVPTPNVRHTLDTQLNVFETFEPKLSEASRNADVRKSEH